MGIGVGGLISGLDTENIISQMMEIERQPIVQLQRDEAFYQSKISALGTLKGGLSALQSSLSTLTNPDSFTAFSVSSSNTALLSVSGTGTSSNAGEYHVTVTDLAQSEQVRSSSFASSTQAIGTGTLTLQVGSGTAVDITIDSTNNTLDGIADAINKAGTETNAAVLDDGKGNVYLTLTSKNSGLVNTISMTMADSDGANNDTSGLSSLFNDPAAGTLFTTQAAKNAQLTVNGIATERASNTIDDLIDGLTLTVNAKDAATPLTITISDDLASVSGKVQSFVSQYNSLVDSLTSLQKYDAASGASGSLQGDGTTRSIQTRIQSMLHTKVDGVATSFNGLSELGMEIDKNGKMSLDTSILESALTSNRTDVSNFFSQTTTGKEGFAVQMDTLLEGYISSSGILAAKEDGLKTSITDVGDRIDDINYRLDKRETTLRAQFKSLEMLMANFENTSGVLTGQLDSLSNLSSQIYKK